MAGGSSEPYVCTPCFSEDPDIPGDKDVECILCMECQQEKTEKTRLRFEKGKGILNCVFLFVLHCVCIELIEL